MPTYEFLPTKQPPLSLHHQLNSFFQLQVFLGIPRPHLRLPYRQERAYSAREAFQSLRGASGATLSPARPTASGATLPFPRLGLRKANLIADGQRPDCRLSRFWGACRRRVPFRPWLLSLPLLREAPVSASFARPSLTPALTEPPGVQLSALTAPFCFPLLPQPPQRLPLRPSAT